MIHLITGGSGSGKSEYAENILCGCKNDPAQQLIYIATMYPYDDEAKEKIRRHRQMRSRKGFETIECYMGLGSLAETLKRRGTVLVLLECVSNLVSNELYRDGKIQEGAADKVLRGVKAVGEVSKDMVIVTNEVNSEGLLCSPEMVRYKQTLGEVNCRLAGMADRVTEVVYNIAWEVKERV